LEENCPGSFMSVNGPVTVISTLPGFHDADLIFRAGFEPWFPRRRARRV